jgi:ElaB/YqjD/DUF883 family membrane-anchored ribosome-binding protein
MSTAYDIDVTSTTGQPLEAKLHDAADRAAAKAERALESTKRVTTDALDSLQKSVNDLRESIPASLGRSAAQVEDLARRGIERARQTSAAVGDRVGQAGERTTRYIQDEPVKAVLIAAAAGAATAMLLSWLGRSRETQSR